MKNENKKWFRLQEWIANQFQEIDPSARSTKQSGAGHEKGDILNKIFLNVEAKCYQKKNVWEVEWLDKAEQEIPLHSDKMAIVVTENKEGKRHVHLSFEDFWDIYKRSIR